MPCESPTRCGRRGSSTSAREHDARVPADLVTREELLAQLGSRHALDAALAGGRWQRVLRGTYVPGGTELTMAVRAQAARRLLPENALLADRCLLAFLGVDVLPPGSPTLEVVLPRGAVVPQRHGVHARLAMVRDVDRWTLTPSALPSLRPARAVADLLRLLPLVDAVAVADATIRAELVHLDALLTELAGHAGWRGVRAAHRALGLSDPRAESPPESRLRVLLTLAGLPPEPQYVVRDRAGRFLARVDLAFPTRRLAIEYDGRVVHDRADVFTRDRQRQNALVRAGWVVLRFTAADLRNPAFIVAQVRAVLAAAA